MVCKPILFHLKPQADHQLLRGGIGEGAARVCPDSDACNGQDSGGLRYGVDLEQINVLNRNPGNGAYMRQKIKFTEELVSKTARVRDKVGLLHID